MNIKILLLLLVSFLVGLRTYQHLCIYRDADKSLARPTSRCILFDGENISFDASLVLYINSTNIPPIMIINRIYETQNFLSLYACFLPGRAKDWSEISKVNTEPKMRKKLHSLLVNKVIFLRKGKRLPLPDISGENSRSVCSGRAVWEHWWHKHTDWNT